MSRRHQVVSADLHWQFQSALLQVQQQPPHPGAHAVLYALFALLAVLSIWLAVGELDIVARDGDTLVFVEVKARRTVAFGAPEEAVTWRKRRKLQVMAGDFLARSRLHDVPCRFDVVSVSFAGRVGSPRVEVFRQAFDAA